MTAWGNRYSPLFQEAVNVKSIPTLPSSSPDAAPANQAVERPQIYSKQPSRATHPSNSSVFVAGLPHHIPLPEIQQRLRQVISQVIDPVHVKIVDGQLGTKVAFVQTRSVDDANLLLNTEIYLEGKTLRLELAHAHRTLWLSYANVHLPPPTTRIVRNNERFLRCLVNEPPLEQEWTPCVPDDPFSGTGHVLGHKEYTESALRKLCEILGPLEDFKRVELSAQVDPSRYEPHVLHHPGNIAQSGIWEVKWQAREDAIQARAIFTTLPFVNWSWAHTMNRSDVQFTSDSRINRPYMEHPSNRTRFNGNNSHFQHNHDFKKGCDSVPPTVRERGVPARQPLKLDIDEFPPLTTGQLTASSGRNPAKHKRTVSEDSDAPITPVSLHHPSPEIANLSGEDNGADPVLSTPTFEKFPPTARPVHRPDAIASKEHGEYTYSYDRSMLYVSGIPRVVHESQLEQLMGGYGPLKTLNIVPTRGDFSSAFISYHDVETAAKVLEATANIPPMIGYTRLRVRYKRINLSRSAPRRRFPTHGNNRAPKPTASKPVDEVQQPIVSENAQHDSPVKFEYPKDGQKDNEKNAQDAEGRPLSSSIQVSGIDGEENLHVAGDSSVTSMEITTGGTTPKETQIQVPTEAQSDQASKDVLTPVQETVGSVTSPSPPKPAHYGYYGPSFPPSYYQHWGYPYPMYGPVYPYQPYGHPYWYPSHPVGIPVPEATTYATPRAPDSKTENGRMEHASLPPYGGTVVHPPFAPTRPLVAPAASYQNPDGGITYVYPTEVTEKYTSGTVNAQENENADSCRGSDAQPTQSHPTVPGHYPYVAPYPAFSMPPPLRFRYSQEVPDSQSAYDVNPSIAAAIYRDYPLPPPPAEKMPQGSFVFNPQGVVQHVEPTGYGSTPLGTHTGNTPEHGIGLAQAVAAVVASEVHYPPCPTPLGFSHVNPNATHDVDSATSRYGSPLSSTGWQYHHQLYAVFPPRASEVAHTHREYLSGATQGTRGNRRRGGHMASRAMYPTARVEASASAGDRVNGGYNRGGQA